MSEITKRLTDAWENPIDMPEENVIVLLRLADSNRLLCLGFQRDCVWREDGSNCQLLKSSVLAWMSREKAAGYLDNAKRIAR
jgi:hypothetical protein